MWVNVTNSPKKALLYLVAGQLEGMWLVDRNSADSPL